MLNPTNLDKFKAYTSTLNNYFKYRKLRAQSKVLLNITFDTFLKKHCVSKQSEKIHEAIHFYSDDGVVGCGGRRCIDD